MSLVIPGKPMVDASHREAGQLVRADHGASLSTRLPPRSVEGADGTRWPRSFLMNPVQCDGPGVDPWISSLRDRVMTYDDLARFAEDRFGPPTACEGTVTTEFDGSKFGALLMGFAGGVSLEVVTMPIESSVTTLRADAGFRDEAEIRQVLKRYASGLGLAIDWSTPEVLTDGAELIHRFWDPESGINASASLIFSEDRLVAICVSMAL
jgi:hypothetical protein